MRKLDDMHTDRRQGTATAVLLLLLMAAAMVLTPQRSIAKAASPGQTVDTGASCEIRLTECPVEGQRFSVFRLARMQQDGSLVTEDALAGTVAATGFDPADLAGQELSADELETRAETWKGSAMAAGDSLLHKEEPSRGGTAAFEGLVPGCYLVVSDEMTAGDTTYTSGCYLVSVPGLNEDGTYIYNQDVVASKVTKTHVQTFENVVQKLWKNAGADHPASVRVQIYDGGKLFREVTLDASNDWTYRWEGEGSWSVVEVADSMQGYKASIASSVEDKGTTQTTRFQITNAGTTTTTRTDKGGIPDMGDLFSWKGMLSILAAGIGLMAAGLALSGKGAKGR